MLDYTFGPVLHIGIDQSLNHTGVALVDSLGNAIACHAIIVKKLRGAERLAHVQKELADFLGCYSKVIAGAIEGPSLGSKHREFDLGEISGVLKADFFTRGIDLIVVPPTTLKKFVTGKGAASKGQMLYSVNHKYALSLTDDNLADAFGLARFSLFHYAFPKISFPAERHELETIRDFIVPKKKKLRRAAVRQTPNNL